MAKPDAKYVTLEVDGVEVSAPEGELLLEAARKGDVEIPYFCYEPKLGGPIGACRQCLVEVEGMPKLQISCATPVQDGMVVYTQSEKAKAGQKGIVEFLLINHPLDCPVCDKGGECPLQDISFGWGAGRSRFFEPKRHFKKPIELSPLVAIDRERCILCYRCVRFSQEISEDYQLVFLERGDHTYVGTHEGHPYVGPFSGNVIELCPVGALTSNAYRFRARPWDVEDAGSVCTLCPSQCNIKFTVRDDARVMRVQRRDNEDVDDGWLCDKGRFGYQAIHAPERILEPMVREDGELRPASWERALAEAAAALEQAGPRTAALVGGETSNEEGFLLQRLVREVLGSPHVDSRPSGRLDPAQARHLARPDLSAAVPDIEGAGTVLVLDTELVDESPILDLRVRKARRRGGTRVVVASSRLSTLDPDASATLRFAPGAAEAALVALSAALGEGGGDVEELGGHDVEERLVAESREQEDERLSDLAARAGAAPEAVRAAAAALRGAGPVVVLWGERLTHGQRGQQAVAALLSLARTLNFPGTDGAGLLEVPSGTNSRGLREVGCVPAMGPGLRPTEEGDGANAMGAAEIPAAVGEELSALLLLHADPLRTHPARGAWESALEGASTVVGFADFLTDSLSAHADVVFPAESYAEKEGTVTHPDGRLQRLRQSIGRPGEVRPVWTVLADLSGRLGTELDLLTSPMVTSAMAEEVPFYAGLTLEEIGGRGLRWQERAAASSLGQSPLPDEPLATPPELPEGLRLGTAPSLWSHRVAEHAPALRFLVPVQRAEIAAEDARRLRIAPGDELEVVADGTQVRATASLREELAPGNVFLTEGTSEHNATALTNGAPRTVEVRKVDAERS